MATVRKELEPGLGISRLEPVDFFKFLRLAAFTTSYVRTQQVRARGPPPPPGGRKCVYVCV